MPKSRREKLKKSYKFYLVKKFNKELKEKVEYRTLIKTVFLSEIIDAFKLDNLIKNGLNDIIKNYKNIVINPLTSPGEGVTVFTSPNLSAGAPALGEAKGLINDFSL